MKRERWTVGPVKGASPKPWQVLCGRVVVSYCDTQRDGIAFAAAMCVQRWLRDGQPCELRIKGCNGRIRDSRSYGRDPRKVRG